MSCCLTSCWLYAPGMVWDRLWSVLTRCLDMGAMPDSLLGVRVKARVTYRAFLGFFMCVWNTWLLGHMDVGSA